MPHNQFDQKCNFKDEANNLLVQNEKEINRVRGRVASLVDEKCNLIKRITVLEEQAKKCDTANKAPFSTSQNSGKPTNENNLDDQSNETDLVVQLEDLTKTDIAESSKNDVENPEELKSITHCETELQETNKEITSQNTNAETRKTPNYDFVMLCDSNRRYLDINKLCSSNNTKMIACGKREKKGRKKKEKKATEIINNPKFTVNQALIINTGVNDVEHLKPVKIIEDQVHLVEAASHMFPGRKIILSDITPRTDNLDQAIININNDIHERIKDLSNVQHVYNGNLRQYKFFYDAKHLSKRLGIPLLAKNFKNGLPRALRPQQRHGNSCQQTSNPQPQARNQSHTMAPEITPPAPVPMLPLNQPVNAQIETTTLKPTVTVQEQLQNMNNLLNHFVSIFNFGQPQLQRQFLRSKLLKIMARDFLKIGTWNIEGLSAKLDDSDFISQITNFDLITLVGTWLPYGFNNINIPGKILLCGDFNARTGTLNDFIDNEFPENDFQIPIAIEKRCSKDSHNNYGRSLLDLCVGNNLIILNGRTKGDFTGQYTCHTYNGASVVDYAIASYDLLKSIINFSVDNVNEFSHHSCLSFVLSAKTPNVSEDDLNIMPHPESFSWNENLKDNLGIVLDSKEVQIKLEQLFSQTSSGTLCDINSIVECLM
ncbi:Hypothetical predicted protein [Paramuricea clavata]|uniref:Uncharacterized protein n=1 Tax=Paramuricea clavata TaxID=317549 RepID=A0A6S7FZ84_PARCT|nr:Hypothetical predicted protein [Paramuricea clavata]